MMVKHTMGTLALLALLGTAPAQEYTIKFKSVPDKGQVFVVKENETNTSDSKLEINGMTIPEVKKATKDIQYDFTVVKPGDKKPAEFTRIYSKAVATEGKKETKLPYDGRTLTYVLDKDEYKVTAEGKPEIAKKELDALAKQSQDPFDALDDILDPGKKVKVGDTWTPEKDKLKVVFGKSQVGKVDFDKSKGSVKLLKVYEKDKQQWGSFELVLEIVLTELAGPGAALKFAEPAAIKANLTLDRPIDGSSPAVTVKGTMGLNFKGSVEQGGMTINVESKVTGDVARSMTEKK